MLYSCVPHTNPEHNMNRCPYPGCRFEGTDAEVDDHRAESHRDEPQAGSNR